MAEKIQRYGCQQYDEKRLCRYDRRAIDRQCDGCKRTTDFAYLAAQGLWQAGVSHREGAVHVAVE